MASKVVWTVIGMDNSMHKNDFFYDGKLSKMQEKYVSEGLCSYNIYPFLYMKKLKCIQRHSEKNMKVLSFWQTLNPNHSA